MGCRGPPGSRPQTAPPLPQQQGPKYVGMLFIAVMQLVGHPEHWFAPQAPRKQVTYPMLE